MTDDRTADVTADDVIAEGLAQGHLSLDDLALLANLPIDIVASAAAVEVDDGNCSMAEILVGIRGIVNGAESYTGNRLIAAAFAAYKSDGGGEERLMALCESVPPNQVTKTLADCRDALERLADRPDWAGFAAWLQELAVGVVQASTKGGFLGIGGERVTRSESRFLSDLTAALGGGGE